jgi:hypothetical protein
VTSGSRTGRAVLVIGLAACAACAAPDVGVDPVDAVPSAQRGPVTPVDVCRLVPAAEVSGLTGARLSVVDARYLSAALATYRCGFGSALAHPRVTVSLAPGPVALAVFDAAYGDTAGGDPLPVERLGERAYRRNEADLQSLVVLRSGAIVQVTVRAEDTPEGEERALRPRSLVLLTRTAVGRLPDRPVLDVPRSRPPCTEVRGDTVEAALGRPVALATLLARPDGSVICSWAGLPGSVTVSVLHDLAEFDRAARVAVGDSGTSVRGIAGGGAWSADDIPGDLTLLLAPSTVAHVVVVPAVGWARADQLTTMPEIDLAREVVRALT